MALDGGRVTPPPIRYPLPTLLLAAALALAAWKGSALTAPLRAALTARWERAARGPDVPSSDRPMAVAGPLVRRVLLLRDDVPVADRPGGPAVDAIRSRMFADVYDGWPLAGPPTHYRVGNRRPIGWVAAADALAWDTRLVVRAPGGSIALADKPGGRATAPLSVGDVPMPVLEWRAGSIRVAAWEPRRPWAEVARVGWVKEADLSAESWGAWMGGDELLILLRPPPPGEDRGTQRLRALLGRLGGVDRWSAGAAAAVRGALPAAAFTGEGGSARDKDEALARLNEQWSPDASWSGLSFRAVPLKDLP